MKHFTPFEISQFLGGALSTDQAAEIRNHLKTCEICKNKVIQMKGLESIMTQALLSGVFERTDECLTDLDVAAYLEGNVSEEVKFKIEAHINSCPICNDIVEMKRAFGQMTLRNMPEGFAERVKERLGLVPEAIWEPVPDYWRLVSELVWVGQTIQIQVAALQLSLQIGRRALNDWMPKVRSRYITKKLLGDTLKNYELSIDLPDSAGQVMLNVIPQPSVQVSVTPKINDGSNEQITVEHYEGKRRHPQLSQPINNHKTIPFSLGTGQNRICIRWKEKKWEIPLEIGSIKTQ